MSKVKVFANSLWFFVPLIIIVLLSVFTFYYSRTDANHRILVNAEKVRTQILSKYLNSDLEAIVSDLNFLSSLPTLPISNDHDVSKLAQEFYQFSKSKKIYDQIRILDSKGMEKVRVNYNFGEPKIVAKENLQNKKGRYYFDDTFAMSENEIFISPLDLNIEHGQIEKPLKPMIRFGKVLIDKDGEKKGILLLNYLASNLLGRFKDFQQTSQGKSYLINRQGYYLFAENPEITWGFMYPDDKNMLSSTLAQDHPDAWSRIIDSNKGQFEISAGFFTFDTIYPMATGFKSSTGSSYAVGASSELLNRQEYQWKLVTFIPNDQLYYYDHSLRTILIYFIAVASTIIGFGAYKFSATKQASEEAKEEVKALQGIIPICMYCKEIRDEEGAWNRLEEYIESYSEAQFSHGICEQCMEEKFGKYKKP